MAQKKEQWFMIAAASLFLVGAVFVLVNSFGGQEWALWCGLGCAVAAILLYLVVQFAVKRSDRKNTANADETTAAMKSGETAAKVASDDTFSAQPKDKTAEKSGNTASRQKNKTERKPDAAKSAGKK